MAGGDIEIGGGEDQEGSESMRQTIEENAEDFAEMVLASMEGDGGDDDHPHGGVVDAVAELPPLEPADAEWVSAIGEALFDEASHEVAGGGEGQVKLPTPPLRAEPRSKWCPCCA